MDFERIFPVVGILVIVAAGWFLAPAFATFMGGIVNKLRPATPEGRERTERRLVWAVRMFLAFAVIAMLIEALLFA